MPFDGAATYRLTVPANAPVKQYWSATVYDRETHALVRNMPSASRASISSGHPEECRRLGRCLFRSEGAGGQGSQLGADRSGAQVRVAVPPLRAEQPLFDHSWKLPDAERVAATIGGAEEVVQLGERDDVWVEDVTMIGRRDVTGHIRKAGLATALALASFAAQPALAASGGVSFWLPGIFGSLAAVPVTPGWAYSTIYLHLNEKAGGGQNFVTSGGIPGSVTAGLNAHADAFVMGITYTSPMPVLGGQPASPCSPRPATLAPASMRR